MIFLVIFADQWCLRLIPAVNLATIDGVQA